MNSIAIRFVTTLFLLAVSLPTAVGQDLRVFTRVYNLRPAPEEGVEPSSANPPVIARSLSLFHAGLVYDLVEPAGEVIVFDPGNRKFTILSTDRMLATTVSQQKLDEMLKKSREETEKYLDERAGKIGPNSVASLRFQLAPRFDEKFDPASQRLSLSSKEYSYDVECAKAKVPEAVARYLAYADWTASLNHVLHPTGMYPGPRLALNRRLRERKLLPTSVELRATFAAPIHLKAMHQIHWELSDGDLKLINRWSSMLRDRRTRHVSFRDYQKTLLAKASKR